MASLNDPSVPREEAIAWRSAAMWRIVISRCVGVSNVPWPPVVMLSNEQCQVLSAVAGTD